ncbi:MAG: putative alpha/beta superfamily hydrolase, partial [Vicingaceae bacterium]
ERDFTVTKLKTKRANTMGGGKNFLNFIDKELISYIDKNYRTEPHRTLVGHSLGGLFTLNAYMDEHSVFDAYLSIDPSIWWDEETMKNKVDGISPICFKRKIYIATANKQKGRFEKNKKRHNRMYALLKITANEKINIQSYDNENHRSVPLIALYEGLKYLHQDN